MIDVVAHHAPVVHAVQVVAGQDQHVARSTVHDVDEVVTNGIRGSLVPSTGVHSLLGRPQLDELTELPAQETPALLDVQNQGVGFVLGQYANTTDTRIDAVGEREVDDAELARERHGGLGAYTR